MESIVIMVIIGIVSAIFQNMNKESKEQKKAAEGPKPSIKKVQPAVKVNKNVNKPVQQEKKKPADVVTDPFEDLEINSFISGGHMQQKPVENSIAFEDSGEASSSFDNNLLQNITFDDIQKSVVMAEILGKPKAYRSNRI